MHRNHLESKHLNKKLIMSTAATSEKLEHLTVKIMLKIVYNLDFKVAKSVSISLQLSTVH